jgi:NAD(P)-dependent dehydrogenase (short-subunit alcohol dehydrogenase family)
MDQTNASRTVLVTGAGRRLGRVMALHLAAKGWRVGVHYHRSEDEAAELVRSIETKGGKAHALRADLAKMEELEPLVRACADVLGAPSLLINNAARFEWDDFASLTPEGWQTQLEVDLRAPVFLIQTFAKTLPAAQEGAVINMLDQKVWRLNPDFLSYTVAKSALWAATQLLAQALAPRIRVNAIGPGPVLPSERQSQAEFEQECRSTPLRRGATLEEICAAVDFLLATPSVTGQMLALDGGQHLARSA